MIRPTSASSSKTSKPLPPPLKRPPPPPRAAPSAPPGSLNLDLNFDATSDSPVVEIASTLPDKKSSKVPSVHPATFFGAQTHRYPVRISAQRKLPPTIAFNRTIPHPTSLSSLLPSLDHSPARKPEFGRPLARSIQRGGKWLSRHSTWSAFHATGKPPTLDGQEFLKSSGMRSEDAQEGRSGSFGLASPVTVNQGALARELVGEVMEVMSYHPLPSPFVRPDAPKVFEELSPEDQEAAQLLSRRLTDHAIAQHCLLSWVEEAIDLFHHAHPGWLPWGRRKERKHVGQEPEPSSVFGLAAALVRSNNANRAQELLDHMAAFSSV